VPRVFEEHLVCAAAKVKIAGWKPALRLTDCRCSAHPNRQNEIGLAGMLALIASVTVVAAEMAAKTGAAEARAVRAGRRMGSSLNLGLRTELDWPAQPARSLGRRPFEFLRPRPVVAQAG